MRLRTLAALPVLLVALAACGDDDPSTVDAYDGGPTSSPSAGPSTAPGAVAGGNDQIGGTVSADLTKKPVVTLPQGPRPGRLLTRDVVVGTGETARAGATVRVHYVGLTLTEGKEFDSSWDRGEPAEFPLDRVIPGFAQGIAGMKVGGRREIVIPASLGYADAPPPGSGIPADADLVFVVDLVGLVG